MMEVTYLVTLAHQRCKISNVLHRPDLANQILPQEKCVNRDNFGIKGYKCWSFCQIGLVYRQILCTLCKFSTKRAWFGNFACFYPNVPIFLHRYIRHIRDISQLCLPSNLPYTVGENTNSVYNLFMNKLAKLGDAIAISKYDWLTHWLT